jgi:hypothetical protein
LVGRHDSLKLSAKSRIPEEKIKENRKQTMAEGPRVFPLSMECRHGPQRDASRHKRQRQSPIWNNALFTLGPADTQKGHPGSGAHLCVEAWLDSHKGVALPSHHPEQARCGIATLLCPSQVIGL